MWLLSFIQVRSKIARGACGQPKAGCMGPLVSFTFLLHKTENYCARTNGSGCGSGFSDPYLSQTDPDAFADAFADPFQNFQWLLTFRMQKIFFFFIVFNILIIKFKSLKIVKIYFMILSRNIVFKFYLATIISTLLKVKGRIRNRACD